MAKHSNAFFNPEYGATGLFGLPIHFLIGFCVVVMEFFGLSLLALLTILNPWLRYFSSYDIVLALATWLLVLKTLSIILLLPGVHYARRVYGEEIGFKDITFSLLDDIERMKPFGEGNPAPLFVTKEVSLKHPPKKINKGMYSVWLTKDKFTYEGVYSARDDFTSIFEYAKEFDIVYRLEKNNYHNSIRLFIRDVRLR